MIDCSGDKSHDLIFNNNLVIKERYDNVKSSNRNLSEEFQQSPVEYLVKEMEPKQKEEASFLKKRKEAHVVLHGISQNAIPWDKLIFNKETVTTFLDKTVKKQKI
jgi:hypothetical protein